MTTEEKMKKLWDAMVSSKEETREITSMTPEQLVEHGLASTLEGAKTLKWMAQEALKESMRGQDA
jgi:hypothetical protein